MMSSTLEAALPMKNGGDDDPVVNVSLPGASSLGERSLSGKDLEDDNDEEENKYPQDSHSRNGGDDDVVVVPDRDCSSNSNLHANNFSLPGAPSLGGRSLSGKNLDDDDDEDENKYPQDSYSFLALHGPRENFVFFSFGLMAFLFQFAFLMLMILSVVGKDLQTGNIGDGIDNPGNPGSIRGFGWASSFFPSNTSNIARATQITSLLSFMVFADETLLDIAKALELIPPLWTSSKSKGSLTSSQQQRNERLWGLMFSCVLRFVQGIMAVFAVFLLVMTESSVIDIVLNFTAVNFIAALDDTAFALARWGKFGPYLKREAKRIEDLDLPPSVKTKRIRAWYTAAVLPVSIMLLCLMCGIMVYQESHNKWITDTFRVQFQDNTGFGSYSGCYHLDPDQKIHKRYIYSSNENNKNQSKFGYCLKRRQWMFFVDNGDGDPCSALQNELAHSSRSSSFDVSSSFSEDWFSYFNTPLSMYFIQEDDQNRLAENCGSFVNDGICDEAFNNFYYQFDGGDCCAATCSGQTCGKPQIGNNNFTSDREIDFEYCKDPSMVPLVIEMGPIQPKKPSEKTWWAKTVFSLEGWEDYWQPRLVLECDGSTVLASSNLTLKGFANLTTKIDSKAESCTITTEHFNLVYDASLTVKTRMRAIDVETTTRNPIPKRIGNLTMLDIIDLSGNAFTGTIPSEIGLNSDLKSLILDNNDLTGNIPIAVGKLGGLKELSLSGNSMVGTFPWEILLLSQLTKLNFDNNLLTGTLPTEVALLTSLTHLSLYNNSFHGFIPTEIKALTNLKSLNLGRNSFFGTIPSEILALTNLESLHMEQNAFDGTVPNEIESMSQLKELKLGGNSFNANLAVDFSTLTSLELLDLGENSFVSPFPQSIGLLTKLTHLDLGQNFFSGVFPGELITSLFRLRYLDLHGNFGSGTIPSDTIDILRNLEHLDFDNMGLNGMIPIEIGELRKLTHLDLDGNDLSGQIPSQIGLLTNLVTLDIGQNVLTGVIPTEIGMLTKLTGLWMYFNYLWGTIPCELESLSNLSELNLSFNFLSGLIPQGVSADVGHIASQRNIQLTYASDDCWIDESRSIDESIDLIDDGFDDDASIDWQTSAPGPPSFP